MGDINILEFDYCLKPFSIILKNIISYLSLVDILITVCNEVLTMRSWSEMKNFSSVDILIIGILLVQEKELSFHFFCVFDDFFLKLEYRLDISCKIPTNMRAYILKTQTHSNSAYMTDFLSVLLTIIQN